MWKQLQRRTDRSPKVDAFAEGHLGPEEVKVIFRSQVLIKVKTTRGKKNTKGETMGVIFIIAWRMSTMSN